MTEAKPKLPEGYTPFNELVLCSNTLINVQVPFVIKNKIVLLIGKGDIPKLWLYAPTDKDAKEWKDIVVENRPLLENTNVLEKREIKLVQIRFKTQIIIQVIKKSDELAEVINLDLRPLGFNVYGDPVSLFIANNEYANNTFRDLWAMFGIS